jgi:biopolymer transport protein ExbD
MQKIRTNVTKKVNAISTTSLSDVLFMLLFFFMVTAVMREVDLKVRLILPGATDVKKLENKSLVRYIYIGKPLNKKHHGDLPFIQIDDAFEEINGIGECIEDWRSLINENDLPKMTISLKVDKETEMGIISDVKQEMRRVQALKINYAALNVMQ